MNLIMMQSRCLSVKYPGKNNNQTNKSEPSQTFSELKGLVLSEQNYLLQKSKLILFLVLFTEIYFLNRLNMTF